MTDFIELLKKQNIKFVQINESRASEIMKHEYSYFNLMEYSSLFPEYNCCDKQGFVDLDFSDLYSLAILDEKLRNILMLSILDIERVIKTIFVSDVYRVNAENSIIQEYIVLNREFFSHCYTEKSNNLLSERFRNADISSLSLKQFIDVIHFGTLERFMRSFYSTYAKEIYNNDEAPFERHIDSVRRLRNNVAHCNSLLSLLAETDPTGSDEVAAYLGRNGIKSRTLRTNYSKVIIRDFCHFLHLYYMMDSSYFHEEFPCSFYEYLMVDCKKYSSRLGKNNILSSSYTFVSQVLNIYYKSNNVS